MARARRRPNFLAVLTVDYYGGTEIYLMDIEYGVEDYALWRYSGDRVLHRSKIKNRNGHPYFEYRGKRYYFQDFVRADYL